jgi:hypothetical protein
VLQQWGRDRWRVVRRDRQELVFRSLVGLGVIGIMIWASFRI